MVGWSQKTRWGGDALLGVIDLAAVLSSEAGGQTVGAQLMSNSLPVWMVQ